MNKIKLVCLASLLATTALAQAATPCNGFEIKVKNNLADDLLVRRIQLNGADIQPGGIQKLNKTSEEVFTVGNSVEDGSMIGELVFNTISIPSKEVKIKFDLTNKGLVCEHTDHPQHGGDFAVDKTRLPGKVKYTIHNY